MNIRFLSTMNLHCGKNHDAGQSNCGILILSIMLGLVIAAIFILSCVPPVSKDALVHHLAVPKLYLNHGGMYEIPFMPFSYYPMNMDLLYLIPLYFGNDIIPKFIHFSFALFTGWLIFGYLKRRISPIYGVMGALFFLSIPIIVKLSITVYVDLGLIFFSTASLLLLFRWIENGFRLKTLVFSAFFCGLAMGTKYNGLVAFFLLTLFVPFIYSRYNKAKRPGFFKSAEQGLIFFFIALLVFSPWMARNYHWTGNPIYPLYKNLFSPPEQLPVNDALQDAEERTNRGHFTFRSVVYHETWWQIALLPVRIFFQGKDGDPQHFDGKLNPFLFFLPFFAFYGMRKDPRIIKNEKKIMLTFALLFLGYAFFSSVMRIRYILPIIPPLVILSIFGVRNIIERVQKLNTRGARKAGLFIVFLTLIFSFSLNAHYIVNQFRYVDPFDYINGTLSRDEYIEKFVLEYPVIRYINEKLPPNAKILFIFLGKRGYYCDRKYQLDSDLFYRITKRSSSPEQVLNELKNQGITHLLIRYDIFDKWTKVSLDDRDRYKLGEFFDKHVELLFYKWGYGLSRLENIG